MFRSATAAKPALSRKASFVENSEQVKIETAVLAELRKGLYSISEAMLAKDDSDRSAARFDATPAYEHARSLRLITHLSRSQNPVFRKRCGGWNQPSEVTCY